MLGGVATGLSNGVDCCYTVQKHLKGNIAYDGYALTHVLFTDCFTADFSPEYKLDFLKNYLNILPKSAKELQLEFIFVEFHIDDLFSVGHVKDSRVGEINDFGLNTLKYCSLAYALQKLIKIYYFSSGLACYEFTFDQPSMAYHDMFTLPLLTTKSLFFYSTGSELSRIKKLECIGNWDYAQNHLQVCQWQNDKNCGICNKCIETMSGLNALGILDNFKKRFPTEKFEKNYAKYMGKILMMAGKGHMFEKKVLEKMKCKNMHIPMTAYLFAGYYNLVEIVRVRFRYVRWARKLYRKFHLDKWLYGRATKYYGQSVDKEVLGISDQVDK